MPFYLVFVALVGASTALAIPARPTGVLPDVDKVGPRHVTCGTLVSAFPAAAVRAEIEEAAARDRDSGRKDAWLSPLRGREAPSIPVLVGSSPTQVMSLGSGGDIFRPLRDFPLAGEIHLVDTLSGWGKSPAAVLIEVPARLKALPDAEVRVIARGFTRDMTAQDLCSRNRFYDKLLASPYNATPFGWEVTWNSPAAGKLGFKVWLHVMNYHDPDHFPALVDRVQAKGPLVGVLVTGASEPEGVSQPKLLETMGRNGTYVFDTFADHFGAAAPEPSATRLRHFQELGYRLIPLPDDGRPTINAHRTWVAIRH